MQPCVPIISNGPTPYRIHLHQRIVREIPSIRLWTVFTHSVSNAPWDFDLPEEIQPICFGPGEHSSRQDRIRNVAHEWYKAGKMIQWMSRQRSAAVVLYGYNDPGRFRIIKWCRAHAIPCLLFGDSNIHCDRTSGWRYYLKRAVLPGILQSCAAILHCGAAGQAYFRRYGVSPERMFAVPYEPDYERIATIRAEDVAAVRAQFDLSPDYRHILFVGRLVPEKRPDLLLNAFCQVAESLPNWRLVFAGDGPLLGSLRQAVPHRVKDQIIWTKFINSPAVIASLYAAADVFVLPSSYEPWGVALAEAAVHLPVLASSSVGAAVSLIEEDVNGLTFKSGDQDDLQRKLLLLTSPDRLARMKAAAPGALARWRRENDPVDGLRRALQYVGVLS